MSTMECTDLSTVYYMTMLTVCQYFIRYVKFKNWNGNKVCHTNVSVNRKTNHNCCPVSPSNRSQSQMRSCTPAVFGVQHVMALIALLSSVACLTCRWVTGWFLRTWVPILWLPPPHSMASKDLTCTMSCPALPGE